MKSEIGLARSSAMASKQRQIARLASRKTSRPDGATQAGSKKKLVLFFGSAPSLTGLRFRAVGSDSLHTLSLR